MIKFYKVKGQLAERAERRVPDILQKHCKKAFKGRYYALEIRDDGWWMVAFAGCAVDWATKFPDFWWILEPSLWHDLGHWLIAKGCIATKANDIIDKILGQDVYEKSKTGGLYARLMASTRRRYIEKATNIVDQELGEERKVFEA